MTKDHQSVSNDVRELFAKTIDEKQKRGGTVGAIGFARDAYEKASTLPEAWSQWRQLAAYRLAHLLLRQDGSLQEIDKLLSIAEGADFLEPLRSFCHLAVLHRIRGGMKKRTDQASVADRIEKIFATAKDHVKQAALTRDRSAVGQYIAQEPSFNTLEVLSYALGLPYKLEGIASKDDFLPYSHDQPTNGFRTHAWQILSRDPVSVWMTEEFARREFASRISDGPCVAVEITRDGAKWAFQTSEKADWKPVRSHGDKLIEVLLENLSRSKSQQCLNVYKKDDSTAKAAFRKLIERMRIDIRKLTGKGQDEVFVDRPDSGMIDLTDEIRFLVLRKHQLRRS
jgi:hypothetical protein